MALGTKMQSGEIAARRRKSWLLFEGIDTFLYGLTRKSTLHKRVLETHARLRVHFLKNPACLWPMLALARAVN